MCLIIVNDSSLIIIINLGLEIKFKNRYDICNPAYFKSQNFQMVRILLVHR